MTWFPAGVARDGGKMRGGYPRRTVFSQGVVYDNINAHSPMGC